MPETTKGSGAYEPSILKDGHPPTARRAKLQKLLQKLEMLQEARKAAYAELAGPPPGTFEMVTPEQMAEAEGPRATEPGGPPKSGEQVEGPPKTLIDLQKNPGAMREFAQSEPKGTEAGLAGFGENAVRTLVQFGLFPVDLVDQALGVVKDAAKKHEGTGIGEPKGGGVGLPGSPEAFLADALWGLTKLGGETVKGIAEFTVTNLRDVLVAGNPLRSDDDPEKKAAWERVYATGGLGPVAAALGGRAALRTGAALGVGMAARIISRRMRSPQDLYLDYEGAPKQIGFEPHPTDRGNVIRLGYDEAPGAAIPLEQRGQPLLEYKPIIFPERPVAPLNRWIRNLKPEFIDKFTDGEARTELRRYLTQIGKETPVLAEKFIARLPIARVKELLQKANERHGGLPAEAKNRYYDEGIEIEPNEMPAPDPFYPPVAVEPTTLKQPTQVAEAVRPGEAATPIIPPAGKSSPIDPSVEMAELMDKVLRKKASPEQAARFEELAAQGVTPALNLNKQQLQRRPAPPPAVAQPTQQVTERLAESSAKRLEAQDAPTEIAKAELIKEADQAAGEALRAHEQSVATEATAPASTEAGQIVFAERFGAPLEFSKLDAKRFQPRETAYAQDTYDNMEADFKAGAWEPAAMDDLIVWKDPKTGEVYSLNHTRRTWLQDKKAQGVSIAEVPYRWFKGTEAEAMRFARDKSNRMAQPPTLKGDVDAYREAMKRGAKPAEIKRIFRGKENLLGDLAGLDPNGKFLEVLNQPAREGFPYLQNFARWVGRMRQAIPELTKAHENEIFDFLYQDNAKRNFETTRDQFQNMIEARTGDTMFDPSKPLMLKKGMIAGTKARADTGNIILQIEELKARRNEAKTAGERAALQTEIDRLQAGVNEIVKSQGDMFGASEESVMPQITGQTLESGGLLGWFKKKFGTRQEKLGAALESKVAQAENARTVGSIAKRLGRVRFKLRPGMGLFHWMFTPQYVAAFTPGPKPRIVSFKFKDGTFEALLDKVTGKGGDFLAAAMQKLILDNKAFLEDMNRGNAKVEHMLAKIHPSDVAKKGKLLSDLLDGRPLEEALERPDIHITTKAALIEMRDYFNDWRKKIVTTLRERVRKDVTRQTVREYRMARGLVRARLTDAHKVEIANLSEAKLREMYPDDWGIVNYLPHILPGEYTLLYEGKAFGSARTLNEAYYKVAEEAYQNTDMKPNRVSVEFREFIDPDILRITGKKKHAFLKEIADAAQVDPKLVYEAARGKIGSKEFRDKFTQHMLKRRGAKGHETDLQTILNMYNWSMNRWYHLSKMRRWVEPAIAEMKQNNKPAAEYLEHTFESLWGKRSPSARHVDNALRGVPVIGDYLGPLPTEHALSWVRSATYSGFLKYSPSFKLVMNNLQIFETLFPILGKGEMANFRFALQAKAGKFAISNADFALLQRHGVNDLIAHGGKFGETRVWHQRTGRAQAELHDLQTNIGALASETSNQQGAWLTMYKIGRDIGLSDGNAANYAFLRGNMYTQFAALASDRMMYIRNPWAATAFQYQRFPTKSIEIGMNELRNGRVSPAARWLGIRLLLGGQKGFTDLPGFKTAVWAAQGFSSNSVPMGYINGESYKAVRDRLGDEAAQVAMFGMPAIIGWDMTNRFNILQVPYGETMYEKVGRATMGIPGAILADTYAAASDTKGPEGSNAAERMTRQLGRRVPVLRPLEWVGRLDQLMKEHEKGTYTMRDPAGRAKFRTDLWGVLSQALLTARPIEAGQEDLLVNYISQIVELRDAKLDDLVAQVLRTGQPDFADMNRWNARWPEFSIVPDNVVTRYTARYQQKDLTTSERMLDRAPEIIKAQEEYVRERLFGTDNGIQLGP